MKNIKIALLGVCNSRNTIGSAVRDNDISIEPYIFQPCFLDIAKEGLGIPYKDFFELPSIAGKEETAIFTRKTMQFDLNKRALSTIESINPDYLVIDLSTLTFRTYEIEYRNKKVFSCNAYSPLCYEYIQNTIKDLCFQRIEKSKEDIKSSLKEFAEYLKSNWDLNKIIIFEYTNPDYYLGLDKKIYKYPDSHWSRRQYNNIKEFTEFFSSLLPNVRIFKDSDLKVSEHSKGEFERREQIPSSFHTNEDTQKLQGLLFREFIFNEKSQEIEKVKSKILERIKVCN